jgi:predicted RNase H-like nuclease (RuvC/YqgF family)
MDTQLVITRIIGKTEQLAAKYEKLKALTVELKEENRVLENQLNDYTEIIGDLEMQIVNLKQEVEGKKKKMQSN